jgi:hypothetical protein
MACPLPARRQRPLQQLFQLGQLEGIDPAALAAFKMLFQVVLVLRAELSFIQLKLNEAPGPQVSGPGQQGRRGM